MTDIGWAEKKKEQKDLQKGRQRKEKKKEKRRVQAVAVTLVEEARRDRKKEKLPFCRTDLQ